MINVSISVKQYWKMYADMFYIHLNAQYSGIRLYTPLRWVESGMPYLQSLELSQISFLNWKQ
jgi:hypothetical protein